MIMAAGTIAIDVELKPWFRTPARRDALLAELDGWAGTKFFPGTGRATKGVVADCVSFARGVYCNLGAMEHVDFPEGYKAFHGGIPMLRVLVDTIDSIPNLLCVWNSGVEVDPPDLAPGDLLVGSSGRAHHHVAIYAGGRVLWHCIQHVGVTQGNSRDPMFAKHLIRVYRFMEAIA